MTLFRGSQWAILDKLTCGVFVVDANLCLVYFNPKAGALLGMNSGNSPLGKAVNEVFNGKPELLEFIRQEQNNLIVIKLDPPVVVEVQSWALQDGDYHQPWRVFELNDITLRVNVEEQLHLLSYALESAGSGIMITDKNGIIQWVNQTFSEITGFDKDSAVGKTPNIQKSGAQKESFYKSLWDTLKGGRSWRGEMINKRMDGTLYTEEQTIAPVKNQKGEIINFISVKQDISERKALEKLRDDLIHTIVHDLRNPLTSITMSLDVIEKQMENVDEISIEKWELLEIARSNTRRMANLVNTILDINRLENERIPAKYSVISLPKLLNEAIKFQISLAKGKDLEIVNQVPDDFPLISVDIGLIGRVLQNIIDNAIKFTPHGGKIEIKAAHGEIPGWFKVTIQDSGPGLAPEVKNKLFQKFAFGSGPGHGTGLGLAYCRLAVEAHAGQIWADSEPGTGTQISFTLPLLDDPI